MNELVSFPNEELPPATHIPCRGQGFVYLIHANGMYKIGNTRHLRRRLMALQSQCPVPLEVVHYVETDRYQHLEAELHASYGKRRSHGEWFALSEDDARLVSRHMDTWATQMANERARLFDRFSRGKRS